MSAQDILKECSELIDERGKTYGDFDMGMDEIACEMTCINPDKVDYLDRDIALFNLCQKWVRIKNQKTKHRDSLMDAIAYLAQYIHLTDKQKGWE